MKRGKYIELKELIDVKVLQYIQDQLWILTGVAFITVDYRGIPITKGSGFCTFCKKIRDDKDNINICYKSDAHGGLESAIRKKSYIYRCPAGLVDFSAPIIVDGQYLGAMLCGQVRTDCSEISSNSSIGEINSSWRNDDELVKAYNETTYIEYNKLVAISELVYTMINAMAEKSMTSLLQERINETNIKLAEEIKKNHSLEKKIKLLEEEKTAGKINLQYVFNVVNSIGRLSYMENAKRAEELSYTLAELISYIDAKEVYVSLKEEFAYLKKYLYIQSIRYGGAIKYEINLPEEIKEVRIVSNICLPIVENSVLYGMKNLGHQGIIKIKASKENNKVKIVIEDNGVGMDEVTLKDIFKRRMKNESREEAIFTGKSIEYCNGRLKNYYGEKASIIVESRAEKGTKVIINIEE